jgi:hypothetical protein
MEYRVVTHPANSYLIYIYTLFSNKEKQLLHNSDSLAQKPSGCSPLRRFDGDISHRQDGTFRCQNERDCS